MGRGPLAAKYRVPMKTACVIGAGPSGLAAAKASVDRDVDFDWFEKGGWQVTTSDGDGLLSKIPGLR